MHRYLPALLDIRLVFHIKKPANAGLYQIRHRDHRGLQA